MSETYTNDDPCDGITVDTLAGWIRYDSSGMCKKNNREGLEGDQRDRHQNPWVRLDNG